MKINLIPNQTKNQECSPNVTQSHHKTHSLPSITQHHQTIPSA